VLIFGNPEVGTRVMQCDPAAGLDLPLRVLAYADREGRTWVVYHDPRGLAQDHDLEGCPPVDKVRAALGALTDRAVE
jgi:uncharacterized protein (DUF302 family)